MIIQQIKKNSIADEIGLQIGDKIKAINNFSIKDIIDYRFYISDEFVEIKINRNGQILIFEIEKDDDEELGLSFEPVKHKCCGNKCVFCFVDQNPPNLRTNLYFKDEDFRLSFLHGNYVTLTNITKSDLQRIIRQRLSPLYISVHAVDNKIRSLMLGLKRDDRFLEKIQYLTEYQIELHAQIVLCPSINDGQYLDQTINELAKFYPYLKSIAIVPVGLTRHRAGLYQIKPIDHEYSKKIITKYEPISKQFKRKIGSFFIYLADEFYLSAGFEIPGSSRYENYYQCENGVGMLRHFMDTFFSRAKEFPIKIDKPKKVTIVTAVLAQPFLEQFVLPKLDSIEGLDVSLAVVINQFYGSSVKVTGLLTGTDIYHQLKDKPSPGTILLPENCLNKDGLFLDDWTPAMLEAKLNCKIKISGSDFTELFV